MTSTPTTPTNAKSSGLYEKATSDDALSVTIGATAEAEKEVEDDGTTVALAKGGVTGLARTTGRISLARGLGGISLVRIARKATQDFPLCHNHQEGMKTIIRTRGLGASRSHVQSLASWAALRPQPLA